MSFKNLLEFSYWFNQPFSARGATLSGLVIIFLFFVLTGLSAKIWRNRTAEKWLKEILRRAGNFGLTLGLLGLLWLFFRQERVPFLAWRFWLLFWAGGMIFWAYRLTWYMSVRVPKIRAEAQSREAKQKYLPS